MRTGLIGLALLGLAILPACNKLETFEMQRCDLFDSCVNLQLRHRDKALLQRASHTLIQDLTQLDRITAPTSPGMKRTNALLRSQEWFSANPSLLPLVRKAQDQYRASGGRYNPAVMGNWRQQQTASTRTTALLPRASATVLRSAATMDDIEIQGLRLRGKNPTIDLYFGALRIGHAVDIAHDYLLSLGITHGLVRIGETARALGDGDGKPWTVAFQVPDIGRLSLQLAAGEAVSACWRQAPLQPLYLDPRTGQAASAVHAVILLQRNASAASSSCQALFVAEAQQWTSVAADLGIHALRLWDARRQTHDIGPIGARISRTPTT